jgi:hypothetical protein
MCVLDLIFGFALFIIELSAKSDICEPPTVFPILAAVELKDMKNTTLYSSPKNASFYPLLANNGQAATCHTETKRKERDGGHYGFVS